MQQIYIKLSLDKNVRTIVVWGSLALIASFGLGFLIGVKL